MSLKQKERIDSICEERIRAHDFGEPQSECQGYFIIAAFVLFVAAVVVNLIYGAS